jgi:hypothetical protein
MKYTVLWQAKAELSLAEIWMRSTERDVITRAANSIDDDLRDHPLDIGESRGGQERITFSGPLGAAYSISEKDSIVRVLRIWLVRGWTSGSH